MSELKNITSNDKEANLEKLWQIYKETGDNDAKNEILMNYIKLVKAIVRRMMPKYNRYNEFDDLVNCGVIGLIDAVERFDLSHGVKFEAYAISRIRGEILDYMRLQDWAPASMRKKINAITDIFEQAEINPDIYITDEYVAGKLDMSVDQVQKILAQSHMFNLMNFEDTVNAANAINSAPVPENSLPENRLLDKELKQTLVDLIVSLPEKEKLVITLYYYEGLLLKEIADILDVTESRVSQIHSKVLLRLKAKLKAAM
ncbi:MAG: RNA polymerase sigma factor FliA [Oscillospiraceae bacterium]|nr:RNA polymerase sigma factor FliA [Oscillospiraceae bacterium]